MHLRKKLILARRCIYILYMLKVRITIFIPATQNFFLLRYFVIPKELNCDEFCFHFGRADASTVNDGYVYNLTEFGQVRENFFCNCR